MSLLIAEDVPPLEVKIHDADIRTPATESLDLETVSYTHLDVYKRQPLGNTTVFINNIQTPKLSEKTNVGQLVSGIPTDVYKRQFQSNTDGQSLFNFMQGIIASLKQMGKIRTAENYSCTLKSFMQFLSLIHILEFHSQTRKWMLLYPLKLLQTYYSSLI